MHFHVLRNGQTYGPYTLEDLRRYVASGNVLASDQAKSDEMTEWLPVSQILAQGESAGSGMPPSALPGPAPAAPAGWSSVSAPVAPYPGYGAASSGGVSLPALANSSYPDAPNLNWGLYLLFTILTCSLFSKVMTLVQAAWMQRVQPNSKALLCYGVQYGILIAELLTRAVTHSLVETTVTSGSSFPYGGTWAYTGYMHHPLVGFLHVLYLVMFFVSRFAMRAAMEEHFNTVEPVGLRLNPVMTFFFGGIYHQYHLNRINALKQAARYTGGRAI